MKHVIVMAGNITQFQDCVNFQDHYPYEAKDNE